MKKLLPFALGLLALASCSKKDEATPAAPALVGTWAWSADETVTTSKSSGISSTNTATVPTGTRTALITYAANGQYTFATDPAAAGNAAGIVASGTYTYSGNTLTVTTTSGLISTSTSQVSVLTATDLVLFSSTEDAASTYKRTSKFIRK